MTSQHDTKVHLRSGVKIFVTLAASGEGDNQTNATGGSQVARHILTFNSVRRNVTQNLQYTSLVKHRRCVTLMTNHYQTQDWFFDVALELV